MRSSKNRESRFGPSSLVYTTPSNQMRYEPTFTSAVVISPFSMTRAVQENKPTADLAVTSDNNYKQSPIVQPDMNHENPSILAFSDN